MKTDDLVTMLASGAVAVERGTLERRFMTGVGIGSVVTAAMMLSLLGMNPELPQAVRVPMFWVKTAFAASLVVASFIIALRLSRPGVALGRAPLAIATPLLAMWALAAVTLLAAAPEQRVSLVLGETWTVCPWLIALLAVPVFIGTLWCVSGLAPTSPRTAGAASGLLAGAISTLVYCLHCPEMAAPFLAVWYVLGISIPTLAGALVGPRLLRW